MKHQIHSIVRSETTTFIVIHDMDDKHIYPKG